MNNDTVPVEPDEDENTSDGWDRASRASIAEIEMAASQFKPLWDEAPDTSAQESESVAQGQSPQKPIAAHLPKASPVSATKPEHRTAPKSPTDKKTVATTRGVAASATAGVTASVATEAVDVDVDIDIGAPLTGAQGAGEDTVQAPIGFIADIPKRADVVIANEPSVVVADNSLFGTTEDFFAAPPIQPAENFFVAPAAPSAQHVADFFSAAPEPPADISNERAQQTRSRNRLIVIGVVLAAAVVCVVAGISVALSSKDDSPRPQDLVKESATSATPEKVVVEPAAAATTAATTATTTAAPEVVPSATANEPESPPAPDSPADSPDSNVKQKSGATSAQQSSPSTAAARKTSTGSPVTKPPTTKTSPAPTPSIVRDNPFQ